MYRLLIVDDEQPAIRAMQFMIDWQARGFDEICTATDTEKARQIFAYKAIDIIICDIQMPGEDGLSLMHWVKERYPATQFIFLTAHDRTEYIREALRGGCVDYLLKPVDEKDLDAALEHAITRREQDAKLMEYDEMQDQKSKNLSGIYITFWQDFLFGRIQPNKDEIAEVARERGLIFMDRVVLEQFTFLPMLCCIRQWLDAFDEDEKRRLLFAIRNLAEENFIEAGLMGQFFLIADETLAGCFMIPSCTDMNSLALPRLFDSLYAACEQYFSCHIRLLINDAGPFLTMPDRMNALLRLQKNVVTDEKWLWLRERMIPDGIETPAALPDMRPWAVLVENNHMDVLRKEIKQYLHEMGTRSEITVALLYQFRQSYMQLLYSTMASERMTILWSAIDDQRVMELEQHARGSIDVTVDWCILVTQRMTSIREAGCDQIPLADRICRYIKDNLDMPLTREQLSSVFYMHPDHLGRMFKKNTGIGLAAYIQETRIERAAWLLTHTELPVGDISLQVGFQNFSYFCKVFREQVHISPQQYRKQNTSEDLEDDKHGMDT